MKKGWIWMALLLALTGCAAEETVETVADDWAEPVMAAPRQIAVSLPDGAVSPVLDGEGEQVYVSEGYEIVIETMEAGDLARTVQSISGYSPEELTILQTGENGAERYQFVWVSAGEAGERLGRAVILDDGTYHYCMSVLRDASATETSQITWRDVFNSFELA